jgi:hypothetical protein
MVAEAVLVAAASAASPVVAIAQPRTRSGARALAEEVSVDSLAHRTLITVALECLPSGRVNSLAQSPDQQLRLSAGGQR